MDDEARWRQQLVDAATREADRLRDSDDPHQRRLAGDLDALRERLECLRATTSAAVTRSLGHREKP